MSFNSFISSKKPGKSLYIFVWFAAWVPANIVVMLVDATLAQSIIKSFDDSALTAIVRVESFEGLQMPSNLFEKHFRQFILVFNPNK